jgi:hypothetical protein
VGLLPVKRGDLTTSFHSSFFVQDLVEMSVKIFNPIELRVGKELYVQKTVTLAYESSFIAEFSGGPLVWDD